MSDLIEYVKRFGARHQACPVSVFSGVSFVGDFAQIVLDREGQFQTQLCLAKPNAEIPDHGHPNVEQLLVHVTGEVNLRIDGKLIYPAGEPHELPDGICSKNGHCLQISAGQSHGASVGKSGGAFMTFQHWLQGTPTSVENDWRGEPLSPEHWEACNQ